jgi:hypothetical protein
MNNESTTVSHFSFRDERGFKSELLILNKKWQKQLKMEYTKSTNELILEKLQ